MHEVGTALDAHSNSSRHPRYRRPESTLIGAGFDSRCASPGRSRLGGRDATVEAFTDALEANEIAAVKVSNGGAVVRFGIPLAGAGLINGRQ